MHTETSLSVIVESFKASAPVDVDTLAATLGLDVILDRSLPNDVSGKIERDSNQSVRVTINGNHHVERRRFTLAHAIGHFVLHGGMIGDAIVDTAHYRSRLDDSHERDANRYAIDILMPAPLVREKWNKGVKSITEMAMAFEVSLEAARIRMSELHLS